ncbi:MAG TPA: tetratricopeptide repeat protein [Candidatus Sulfotelmatobacter sp.]|nr:tetratricopeptide repeat protein [Candidatus Sulfotelmatobacter sp.]
MTAEIIEQLWEVSKRAFQAGKPELSDQINKIIFANSPSFKVYAELSKMLEQTGQYKSAADALRRAIKIDPASFDAWYQLGYYMYYHADPKDAVDCFQQAVKLLPGNADGRMGLGMAQMIQGDLKNGLANFEARFKVLGQRQNRAYVLENQPRWDGKPTEKRVLIFCEQGNGDAIQFARYHRFVRALAPNTTVWATPATIELFRRHEKIFEGGKDGNPTGTFDVWVPNISLPLVLGMASYEQVPPTPYLTASPELVQRWSARIKPSPRPKVGLVWQGSVTNTRDKLRSIPVDRLRTLAELPVDLYSLQVPTKPEQTYDFCANIATEIANFDDTAAIVAQLDLVISVDTAVAHLAGALGKPVWLLLNHHGEWRWLRGRDDTPWYATARLFRQTEAGNWTGVITRVYDELAKLARQRPAKAS